jgi:hypothetical protein
MPRAAAATARCGMARPAAPARPNSGLPLHVRWARCCSRCSWSCAGCLWAGLEVQGLGLRAAGAPTRCARAAKPPQSKIRGCRGARAVPRTTIIKQQQAPRHGVQRLLAGSAPRACTRGGSAASAAVACRAGDGGGVLAAGRAPRARPAALGPRAGDAPQRQVCVHRQRQALPSLTSLQTRCGRRCS